MSKMKLSWSKPSWITGRAKNAIEVANGFMMSTFMRGQNYDGLELVSDRVLLRLPRLSDYEAWRDLRTQSRAHITKWEPDWQDHDITLEAFKKRLEGDALQMRANRRFSFLIFKAEDTYNSDDIAGNSDPVLENSPQTLVGGISLSDIKMGNRCSGSLGYWIGHQFVRQGYGSAGVAAVKRYGFFQLGLHRIEAACQPGNVESLKLLKKSGFEREGLAREYLKINGNWCDHELWTCRKMNNDE